MGISVYRALIRKAQEEIKNCRLLILKIDTVTGSLNRCSNYLKNVLSNLDAGLRINGASVDSNGNINRRSNNILRYDRGLQSCIPILNNRIKTLEDNITVWKNAIAKIQYEESIKAKENVRKAGGNVIW